MKAMILAAGLGTRLFPYTGQLPKALVPVSGKPMIYWLIMRLKASGIREIIINVHHFADQLVQYIHDNRSFDIDIAFSDERELLLDTGGALKQASWYFTDGQPFILHNVDVLSDLDLLALSGEHLRSNALATLAVSRRNSSRYFLFDESMQLSGWKSKDGNTKLCGNPDEKSLDAFAFSGIQVISPGIFPLIEEAGAFSIVDLYLRLARDHRIRGIAHDAKNWLDMGRPDDLQKASTMIQRVFGAGYQNLGQ